MSKSDQLESPKSIELAEMKQNSNLTTYQLESEESKKAENRELIKTSLITALAIGLHKFPEGLATFAPTLADPTLGVSIAVVY